MLFGSIVKYKIRMSCVRLMNKNKHNKTYKLAGTSADPILYCYSLDLLLKRILSE